MAYVYDDRDSTHVSRSTEKITDLVTACSFFSLVFSQRARVRIRFERFSLVMDGETHRDMYTRAPRLLAFKSVKIESCAKSNSRAR